MKKRNGILLLLVGCVVMLGLGLLGRYFLGLMFESLFVPQETTDVKQYQTIRQAWSPTGLADHFPQTIPPNATNVHLSAFPGFMQGGAHFQVLMILPANEVEKIEENAIQQAIHQYVGGDKYEYHNADPSKNVPTTSFYATGQYAFPEEFTLYVFKAVDHNGGFSWNHGETAGIAISNSTNEVVYWLESW